MKKNYLILLMSFWSKIYLFNFSNYDNTPNTQTQTEKEIQTTQKYNLNDLRDEFLYENRNYEMLPDNRSLTNINLKGDSFHQILLEFSKNDLSKFNSPVQIITENSSKKVSLYSFADISIEDKLIKFTNEKMLKLLKNSKSNSNIIRIFADGGCALQSRLGFFGSTLYLNNDNIFKICGNLGHDCTNNTSEYMGLLVSLIILELMNVNEFTKNSDIKIKFYADSELMVRQMQGRYKVKTPHIGVLYNICKKIYSQLKNKEINHVLRHLNKEADYLGNLGRNFQINTIKIYY